MNAYNAVNFDESRKKWLSWFQELKDEILSVGSSGDTGNNVDTIDLRFFDGLRVGATGRCSSKDIPNVTTRIAGCKYAFGQVSGDHAAGADDGARSDAHPGEDKRTTAHPDVLTYRDRLSIFLFPSQGRSFSDARV